MEDALRLVEEAGLETDVRYREEPSVAEGKVIEQSLKDVSYTHLDVYKRQGCDRAEYSITCSGECWSRNHDSGRDGNGWNRNRDDS